MYVVILTTLLALLCVRRNKLLYTLLRVSLKDYDLLESFIIEFCKK